MCFKSFILKGAEGSSRRRNFPTQLSMKLIHVIGFILLTVGGINWGLVGLGWLVGGGANWNLVHMILGSSMQLEALVYVLVGLSAVWLGLGHGKDCRMCKM